MIALQSNTSTHLSTRLLRRRDRHVAEASMLTGAACLRLAHGLRDGGEVELTWVVLETDGDAFDDEVHGGVVEGSSRRLAQLHLEPGGGQCDPQIRGELRVGAVAVVDEEARALNVADAAGQSPQAGDEALGPCPVGAMILKVGARSTAPPSSLSVWDAVERVPARFVSATFARRLLMIQLATVLGCFDCLAMASK